MADTRVDDELWNEFHRVVNMSSRELGDWLRTRSAQPDTEQLPDQSGTPTGQRVLAILGKRRTDLDGDDVRSCAPWSTACMPNAARTSNPPRARPAGGTG